MLLQHLYAEAHGDNDFIRDSYGFSHVPVVGWIVAIGLAVVGTNGDGDDCYFAFDEHLAPQDGIYEINVAVAAWGTYHVKAWDAALDSKEAFAKLSVEMWGAKTKIYN